MSGSFTSFYFDIMKIRFLRKCADAVGFSTLIVKRNIVLIFFAGKTNSLVLKDNLFVLLFHTNVFVFLISSQGNYFKKILISVFTRLIQVLN